MFSYVKANKQKYSKWKHKKDSVQCCDQWPQTKDVHCAMCTLHASFFRGRLEDISGQFWGLGAKARGCNRLASEPQLDSLQAARCCGYLRLPWLSAATTSCYLHLPADTMGNCLQAARCGYLRLYAAISGYYQQISSLHATTLAGNFLQAARC